MGDHGRRPRKKASHGNNFKNNNNNISNYNNSMNSNIQSNSNNGLYGSSMINSNFAHDEFASNLQNTIDHTINNNHSNTEGEKGITFKRHSQKLTPSQRLEQPQRHHLSGPPSITPSKSSSNFNTTACVSLASTTSSFQKSKSFTLSVALSATVLSHLAKPELRTYVAGQIGRMLTLFQVDEVIVYKDASDGSKPDSNSLQGVYESAAKKDMEPRLFLARLLQFLEAPPYLRKSLFPVHRDLQFAGLLNPLESPHHMKADDPSLFRGIEYILHLYLSFVFKL